MDRHRQSSDSLDELDMAELERFRRMSEAAPVMAVIFAQRHCAEYDLPRPHWVADMAVDLLLEEIRPDTHRTPGRASAPIKRFRQDMVHVCRWDEVTEMRRGQQVVKERVENFRRHKDEKGIASRLDDQEKLLEWLGHTWLRAYECASMKLKGTIAGGCPETMKASYQRVQKAMNDPGQADHYHLEAYGAMEALGDEKLMELFRGKKWEPLYNLTP